MTLKYRISNGKMMCRKCEFILKFMFTNKIDYSILSVYSIHCVIFGWEGRNHEKNRQAADIG